MIGSGPFRSLLAVVLMAVVPLCCCDLRGILAPGVAQARALEGTSSPVTRSGCCGGEGRHDDVTRPTSPSTPGKPIPAPCNCELQKKTVVSFAKIMAPEFTPVLLYVAPESAPEAWIRAARDSLRRGRRCPRHADCSLLRQHCALIV